MLNKSLKGIHDSEEPLIKTSSIEETGAWLINNSLYNENSVIHLIPNSTYVTFDDIRKLYRAIFDFFKPSITFSILTTGFFSKYAPKMIILKIFLLPSSAASLLPSIV